MAESLDRDPLLRLPMSPRPYRLSTSSTESEFNDENSEDLSFQELTQIPDYLTLYRADIKCLHLDHNMISDLPPTIRLFTNLVTLDISNNDMRVICPEITSLRNLQTFTAKNNLFDVDAIPKDFGRLSCLECVNMSGNLFTKLPIQFTELPNLTRLFMGGNQLVELPPQIKNLKLLEVLYLGGNKLTDLPSAIGRLSHLTSLVLCDNALESLPDTMMHLSRLQSLSLHNNRLSTLPPEIVALNLVELSLRNNPLVARFVQDMVYDPPSLLELSGRVIKVAKIQFTVEDLPKHLIQYLQSAHQCVNPKCKGVYFTCRAEHVKFVDFCGKYRLPLLQYLCSPQCTRDHPVFCRTDTSESEDEDGAKAKMKKVLLG